MPAVPLVCLGWYLTPPPHTHTHSRTHVCNMTFMSPVQKPVSLSTLETAQELQGMGRELNFHQKHRK